MNLSLKISAVDPARIITQKNRSLLFRKVSRAECPLLADCCLCRPFSRAVITSRSEKVSFNLSKGSKTRPTTTAHAKQLDEKIGILTEEEMKF